MLTGNVQHKDPEIAALGNHIAEKLGIDTDLVMACIPVMLENLVLMNKKQHDYGPHNLTKFGTFGVVVRANDKLERLVTLTKPGAVARVNDEGIADTLRDLSNYGTIGYVIEKKLWPRNVTPTSDAPTAAVTEDPKGPRQFRSYSDVKPRENEVPL